ncbi:sigma-70 family RNA polymerase sigma factor [Herbaspirillum sp. HC18]|nr:sigma-70 family RNA polymerase sigma factor [Herbaspirillum sp. HC18]
MRPFADIDDQQCVMRARQGEGRAFSELVARYQDRVYRFLLRLTRSRDDAMDLTQDTFMRAYQSLDRWQPDALFRTWLFRIARNGAIDRFRRDKVVEFVDLDEDADVPDHAAGPEAVLETAQRLRILEEALERLPAEYREIILLREIEGMSYDELAQVLGLQAGTVKSRLSRARAALLDMVQRRLEITS